jgi:transcriptional regulator with XRE-family HTH domain
MPEPVEESVGDRLRQVRGDMTQDAFAQLLGIGRTTLVRYEKGERPLDSDLLTRLWVLFKTDALWLLTGIGERTAGEILTTDERDLLRRYRAAPLAVKMAAVGALQGGAGAQPRPLVKNKVKGLLNFNSVKVTK